METVPTSSLRAACRAVLLVAFTCLTLVPVFFFWAVRLDKCRAQTIRLFYTVAIRIAGVRIEVLGELSRERPLMLIGNHTSYLDIFVLGTLAPLSFTPKKEIRSWPVIGFLCVLADCVFVERKPSEITQAKAQMERRLDKDKVICLFPEGTTGDGSVVLPFKSGFLSLAEEYEMPVQPATTVYTHIGTHPVPEHQRDLVAWVGDAALFGHLLRLLGFPSIEAVVTLHPSLSFKDYEDRKALTKAAEDIVRAEVKKIHQAQHAG